MEQGVALKAHDPVALEYKLGQLLTHPERLARMRANTRGLGHAEAARAVLDHVLNDR
jgi:processive 1,2-diacylglycerol beta-glucosyltransferase